jgi:dipeptidase E
MKNFKFLILFFVLLFSANIVFAYRSDITYLKTGEIKVSNPEISQGFFDELKGKPRDYIINSVKDFDLYVNILVPLSTNQEARYNFNILDSNNSVVFSTNSLTADWQQYYDSFARDYYFKGPEFTKTLPAGKYKIEVSSSDNKDNKGKYVLFIGKSEKYTLGFILNSLWQLPLLKILFFKTSILQFFFTYFGIGFVLILGLIVVFIAFINYIMGVVKETIKHNQAKTLLLTSAGMDMKKEIIKLLQKPAYDVNVAFITTAAKQEDDVSFVKKDFDTMKDMGFNIEELDIEGKNEMQLMETLRVKDIVFVEGGNTFYLLSAMRRCNFEKVIKKLLKNGIVYIGSSAGSVVAGKTIQTADKFGTGGAGKFGIKDFRGLGLVPFDIFVHYSPEYDEIIKKKIPDPKKRLKNLKILTDRQAILVQAKEVDLIGEGEEIIV